MIDRARHVWRELAGVPVDFGTGGAEVAAAPRSRLCPAGWAGVVVLGGAAIVTVPDRAAVALVRQAVAGSSPRDLTDAAVLRGRLPIVATLGPATLAYCDEAAFRPTGGDTVRLAAADLDGLLAAVPADEAGESGLDEITSPAFVVRDGDRVVAAAGYQVWPGGAAQLSFRLAGPAVAGRAG